MKKVLRLFRRKKKSTQATKTVEKETDDTPVLESPGTADNSEDSVEQLNRPKPSLEEVAEELERRLADHVSLTISETLAVPPEIDTEGAPSKDEIPTEISVSMTQEECIPNLDEEDDNLGVTLTMVYAPCETNVEAELESTLGVKADRSQRKVSQAEATTATSLPVEETREETETAIVVPPTLKREESASPDKYAALVTEEDFMDQFHVDSRNSSADDIILERESTLETLSVASDDVSESSLQVLVSHLLCEDYTDARNWIDPQCLIRDRSEASWDSRRLAEESRGCLLGEYF